jgi:hypothetical protein
MKVAATCDRTSRHKDADDGNAADNASETA